MSNVIPFEQKKVYRSYPERELERMWQDISAKNYNNLSKKLLMAISKDKDEIKTVDVQLYEKQMFDSEQFKYVPFDIWGAHHIVNVRKENLLMRIYQPLPYQNEGGEVVKGWKKYNCTHLEESLREKEFLSDMGNVELVSMIPNQKKAMELHNWVEKENKNEQEHRDKVRLMMEEGVKRLTEYRGEN